MISQNSLSRFKGTAFSRGDSYLYMPPNKLLRPYISNYTISFPTPQSMPDEYTILPTASSTLVVSVSGGDIIGRLRGVNTIACNVGAHANRMKLLLLIEFHPGGLYPFIGVDQSELIDSSFMLENIDRGLIESIKTELMKAESVEALAGALDWIFLARLAERDFGRGVSAMMRGIFKRHGNISAKELASEFFYSEKHIRRMFLQQVGTGTKTFSRIVRVNYALRLMRAGFQRIPDSLTDVGARAGFFDQPHFIHDFKTICGMTPQEYIRNMSVFYNDEYKM